MPWNPEFWESTGDECISATKKNHFFNLSVQRGVGFFHLMTNARKKGSKLAKIF